MQAVILAAGKGSRLHPITLNRSKAMLPILGKPIIERVLESIAANGIEEFIVVVSPGDGEIRRYFEVESKLEANIHFVIQPERRGAGDALRCAAPLIRGEFIQSACDNLVAAGEIGRMLALWREAPRPTAVLSLVRVSTQDIPRAGIVAFDGTFVTRIIEKPRLADALSDIASMPLYCFPPQILDYLADLPLSPRGEYEIQSAIQALIDRHGGVRGMLFPGRLTLTAAADLLAINRHYLVTEGEQPMDAPQAQGPGTKLAPPLYVGPGVLIGANCVIGPNVYIERDCIIGDGVVLKDSVVLRGAVVAPGMVIEGQVLS
jgi:bifunctional UDP-N-acetylglucosamine pyrophosphorylase/glucosamine-1-phosphate N-acetyltransferase